MPKTTVINGTGKPLILQEDTEGIVTFLKKLQPKESYQIEVATYREYWCGVKADDPDSGVVLSSDDCEDLKEVTVIENGIGTTSSHSYVGVNRESGQITTEEAKSLQETSDSESETTKHGRPVTWLRGLFRKPEKGSSSKSPVTIR